MDVAGAAEVRDGVVARLSLALPHQVDALLPLHLLQPNTRIVATDTTVKPPGWGGMGGVGKWRRGESDGIRSDGGEYGSGKERVTRHAGVTRSPYSIYM